VLFDAGGRWKRVRHRIERLDDLRIDDAQWSALALPIRLAFFLRATNPDRRLVWYPSPAGVTEAPLSQGASEELLSRLDALEPDVEALVVDRRDGARCFRLSIDECYRFVGLLKRHWRGFGGGVDLWQKVEQFFVELERGVACPT
jgi:hypothetical protein